MSTKKAIKKWVINSSNITEEGLPITCTNCNISLEDHCRHSDFVNKQWVAGENCPLRLILKLLDPFEEPPCKIEKYPTDMYLIYMGYNNGILYYHTPYYEEFAVKYSKVDEQNEHVNKLTANTSTQKNILNK